MCEAGTVRNHEYLSSSRRSSRRGQCAQTPAECHLHQRGPTCRWRAAQSRCCTPEMRGWVSQKWQQLQGYTTLSRSARDLHPTDSAGTLGVLQPVEAPDACSHRAWATPWLGQQLEHLCLLWPEVLSRVCSLLTAGTVSEEAAFSLLAKSNPKLQLQYHFLINLTSLPVRQSRPPLTAELTQGTDSQSPSLGLTLPRSSYHQVSDSVGVGRGHLAHSVMGHRPHSEDTLLLEHPAGEGHS